MFSKSNSLAFFVNKLILLIFLLLAIPWQKAQATIDGNLRIISPNGGETYTEGDVTTIRWEASSNIDKIMLGYSTGPGSLNWIATSIPNTGSYTWKVNVGNTTRTQFVIDITGYETGKGSLSDKSDGWFTVYQENEFPPMTNTAPNTNTAPVTQINTNTTTPPSPPAPIPVANTNVKDTPKENPTVNIQQNTIISITQIELNEYYYFEGSKTTDLSKVDPKQVENFTLDRMDLMFFTFLGDVDLSGKEAASVMENLDQNVSMDYFYFWFSWEFWILFETDIEATFYDTSKTLDPETPVTINNQALKKEEYKIATDDKGEKKVTIKPAVINKYAKKGEKIEIAMQPTLKVNLQPGQKITSEQDTYKLEGSVTDAESKIFINYNGEKIELFVENGKFNKNLKLEQGNNLIKVLAYKKEANEPYSEIESTIVYQPKAANYNIIVGIISLAIILIAAIYVLKTKQDKNKPS